MFHLGINRTVCVDTLIEQQSSVFLDSAKAVISRDKHVCQLCKFRSLKWQQVITKNQRYTQSDFSMENMITVCPLCFLGQRLGHAALEDKVTFIYLPEMSQADLNNLMRLVYYYIQMPEVDEEKEDLTEQEQGVIDCQSHSEALLLELRDRVPLVSKVYQNTRLNHLKTLVTMLYQLPDEKYEKRDLFFQPIRYLVAPSVMTELNKTYAADVFHPLDGFSEIKHSSMLNLSSFTES
ncbi:hypothetical protein EA007_06475 [Vibrio anguillarum]|uniref:hypothetical protein n=4 Tax=Vibrio anguillarum TaxID=55601 RepID=UPI00188C8877|nr:hypothetical protein [Vibrio anguillarum]MBF4250639.1 hypothetical protein [Vibrio anguillarum]